MKLPCFIRTITWSFLVLALVADANCAPADEKTPDQVKVLVAKKRLGRQTLLTSPQDLFEVRTVPAKKVPKNAFPADKLTTLQGRLLKYDMGKGEALGADYFFAEDIENLEDLLEPGRRAAAVKVGPDATAGGLLLPGSHVDVYHIINGVSTILLENVVVLAVNDTWQRTPNARPVGGKIKTVTLELFGNDQTLKLMCASERGAIRLALRNPRDYRSEPPAGPVPPPPPPPPVFDRD
jgi:Flp pilus assembly protein CpaB